MRAIHDRLAVSLRALLVLTLAASFLILPTHRALAAIYGDVVISEIMYDSIGGTDVEWVELYNPGTSAVDISGWVLTDDNTYPALSSEGQCAIPASTSIPAGGYLVIAKTNPGLTGAVICTESGSFIFGNSGDNLAFFDNTGALIFGSLYRAFPNLAGGNVGDSIGLRYPMAGWSSISGDWAVETTVSTENTAEFAHDSHGAANSTWANTVATPHTVSVDGTVNTSGEWLSGELLGAVDGLTYYVTWDASYIYVGMIGGNATSDKYNVLIDTDPLNTGAGNTGNTLDYCGASFGADGKANYAVQLYPGGVARAVASGSSWDAWSPTDTTGATNGSASGNAEFKILKSDIGLTSASPVGLYLYGCNNSNQYWSGWPPENSAYSASVIQLTTRTVFYATGSTRSPRFDASHLGYQTLSGDSTGERAFFENNANASYPWYARLFVTTAGAAGCQIKVKVVANRVITQRDGGARRLYEIDPQGCSGLQATVILQYEDSSWYSAPDELRGIVEANLYVYRWDGSIWNRITAGAFRDAPTNRVGTTTPQSSFSPWGIGDDLGNQPTVITLRNLTAESSARTSLILLGASVGLAALGGLLVYRRRRI
jgi:hypothetical protein